MAQPVLPYICGQAHMFGEDAGCMLHKHMQYAVKQVYHIWMLSSCTLLGTEAHHYWHGPPA